MVARTVSTNTTIASTIDNMTTTTTATTVANTITEVTKLSTTETNDTTITMTLPSTPLLRGPFG